LQNQSFSNAQLELLDLFSLPLPEKSFSDLKSLLLKFKFEQLNTLANDDWELKKLNQKSMEIRLKSHNRTKYKSQEKHLKI
jgi:hypothetical protein